MRFSLANNKKGFTLVELIVVMVIIALLAALLVPSMIGWINRAQDQTGIVEGRTLLLAAQTIVAENYTEYQGQTDVEMATKTIDGVSQIDLVLELAGLEGVSVTSVLVTDGRVTGMTYVSSISKTFVYSPGAGYKAQ